MAGFVSTGVNVKGTVYSGLFAGAEAGVAGTVDPGAAVRGVTLAIAGLFNAIPPKAFAPEAENMLPMAVFVACVPNPPNGVVGLAALVVGAPNETGLEVGAVPKDSCGAGALAAAAPKPENNDGCLSFEGAGVEVTVFGVNAKDMSEEAAGVAAGALEGLAAQAGCSSSSLASNIFNGLNCPEVSATGGGGEQTDTAVGSTLRKLNESNSPSELKT